MAKQKTPVRNKQRGKELEKEIENFFKKFDFKAERAWGSDGRALGMDETVDISVEKGALTFQAKRKKKLPQFLQFKPNEVNGVIFREDHGEKFIMISLYDYCVMLKALTNEKFKEIFR